MVKIKKRKMHFLTPKRLFHTKLMKKLCSAQKVCPIKLSSGGKVRAPQKTESVAKVQTLTPLLVYKSLIELMVNFLKLLVASKLKLCFGS